MNKLLKRWFLAIFYKKIYKKILAVRRFRVKNDLKLTKNSQKCIKCTKQDVKKDINSTKCIYRNVPKTIDFGDKLWYNNSAWYALKREVAAKAGNFRGVCPLNGRKNSLKREGFCDFPEFVGWKTPQSPFL